ncbi:hypothetical protein FJZ31_14510 [Candidatus Poribacteria bacterium]|nr:hypothetical protein [Candidatus Poribacteria bacterium]
MKIFPGIMARYFNGLFHITGVEKSNKITGWTFTLKGEHIIPELSTLLLFGLGALGFIGYGW